MKSRKQFFTGAGNPKNILDWNDVICEDVGVITPNPKTSGGAMWNYLAAWYYFEQQGQSDVLLAWENEVFLSLEEHPGEYEIVVPSVSILCQPTVAVVDEVAKRHGTEEIAQEYLNYLYSDEAQEIEAQNYYRPSTESIYDKYVTEYEGNTITEIPEDGRWINDQIELTNTDYSNEHFALDPKEQLAAVTDVASTYGHGYIHLTSRQGIEIPFINIEDIDAVKEALAKGDIAPGVCGPRVRTVTACQGKEICPNACIDSQG